MFEFPGEITHHSLGRFQACDGHSGDICHVAAAELHCPAQEAFLQPGNSLSATGRRSEARIPVSSTEMEALPFSSAFILLSVSSTFATSSLIPGTDPETSEIFMIG